MDYTAPADELERRLVQIWEELLGVAPIGVHDDFFQLGGHSLAAMRVLSRVRRDFRVDVPVRTLFECPTIAQFAHELEHQKAAAAAAPDDTILTTDVQTLLNVLRAQLSSLSTSEIEFILGAVAAEKNSRASRDEQ